MVKVLAAIHVLAFIAFATGDYIKKKNQTLKAKYSFLPSVITKTTWNVLLVVDMVTGVILASAVLLGL